eukprot:257882-Chlamydomonas_euryale.AAC.1
MRSGCARGWGLSDGPLGAGLSPFQERAFGAQSLVGLCHDPPAHLQVGARVIACEHRLCMRDAQQPWNIFWVEVAQ